MQELEKALKVALKNFRVRVERAGDDIVIFPWDQTGSAAQPLFTIKEDGLGRGQMYKIVRPTRVANGLPPGACIETIKDVLAMDYS